MNAFLDGRIRPRFLRTASALSLAVALAPAFAQENSTYDIETVAEGLNHAWGMEFVPNDGRLLVTERTGALKLIDPETGEVSEISGLPDIHVQGQGGLLDVALHPDFPEESWIYLTWSGSNGDGQTTTHIGRGQLDLEALEITDMNAFYAAEPFQPSGQGHYGSRLAFDADNRLYATIGDRQAKDFGPQHFSQDTSNDLGTTLRFEADGSIPSDNPFVDDPEVKDAIYSYGHRNVQSMGFHPETGELWQGEHGEFNGDEINIIEAGGNYGWPIATYGVDYRTRDRFAPTPPEVEGTIEPIFWWEADDPEGFPPSGLAFYEGNAFPEWQGNLFMGNLAHQYLGRFSVNGQEVEMQERLLDGQGWRIRDVAVGPDNGYLYVLLDESSAPLIRLVPAQD